MDFGKFYDSEALVVGIGPPLVSGISKRKIVIRKRKLRNTVRLGAAVLLGKFSEFFAFFTEMFSGASIDG